MQNEWLYIGLFLVIGIIVPVVPLVFARLVAPRKPNPIKQSTYECGVETVGESWVQFKAQYYIFALVFLVFDVEVAFMFPWAVLFSTREPNFRLSPLFGLASMVVFLGILIIGYVWLYRKGALEWV